jgi:Inward rectifier potassium channel transmembrane domain
MFTYLVEKPWYFHVILFVVQFILTWCLFGGIYYATANIYRDVGQVNNASVVSCFAHVTDFASAMMFSVETQATIGYGVRVVDPTCTLALLTVIFQTIGGIYLLAIASGLIFANMSRPKGRYKKLLFSEKAVICQRDGQYQLHVPRRRNAYQVTSHWYVDTRMNGTRSMDDRR